MSEPSSAGTTLPKATLEGLRSNPAEAPRHAALVLEDGRAFVGRALGANVLGQGEVVFNTAMTGYQQVLTDASYAGQMLCMTFPLQGNYGPPPADPQPDPPSSTAFTSPSP